MIGWLKKLFTGHQCRRDGHKWWFEGSYIERFRGTERVIVTKACRHCAAKQLVPAKVSQ